MFFRTMFSRRYWLFTLLVIAAIAVCVRAAFWQMDRREQKRELNQRMAQRWDSPPFNLNQAPLPADIAELEFRRIQVTGTFDYEHQIVLKNDLRDGMPGVNLITPLLLADGRAILVARGWIPLDQAEPENWPSFDEPAPTPIVGLIQESQTLPGAPTPTEPQLEWFRVDVAAIQQQLPYPLLPAFLAMLPEPGRRVDALPMRLAPPTPYDEYMHVSYTIQWFAFAIIFGFGYVQYLIMQERRRKREATVADSMADHTTAGELPSISHHA